MEATLFIPILQVFALLTFLFAPRSFPNHDKDDYDFIVVGGGTAGAIIAKFVISVNVLTTE